MRDLPMTQPAIKVEGLWKEYTVGAAHDRHTTFYDVLSQTIRAPFQRLRALGGASSEAEQFWALRDVNFEVQPGEVLGIIGRNGAGKSTLLKILSRITAPTKGRVTVRGRMTSLLEVGTGFHPELSGRENIFLNGALLGMSRADILRKFDQIVGFAEIEKFIDTPVKRYSSGMYVRLAFSVAAHMDPDILVIDEVLAVGDAEFQKRCLGKLEDSSIDGRTVLVVSHNIPMIMPLCRRALWLQRGAVMEIGDIGVVASKYLSTKRVSTAEWKPNVLNSDYFKYDRVSIIVPPGHTAESISPDSPFKIELRYSIECSELRGRISLLIRNQSDVIVLTSTNSDSETFVNMRWEMGAYTETCEIPGNLLMPGVYYLTISQPERDGNAILEDVCKFEISEIGSLRARDGRAGVIAPLLKWER
jgi:lipopolysaccharide transport system ATP-binding protein